MSCFAKSELQQCIPDDNVKNLYKISQNAQYIETLPMISNFLFRGDRYLKNQGVPSPKYFLQHLSDQESESAVSLTGRQKYKRHEFDSFMTGTTRSKKVQKLDKSTQICLEDSNAKPKIKRKLKKRSKKAKVEKQLPKINGEDLIQTNQNQNIQTIRKQFQCPSNLITNNQPQNVLNDNNQIQVNNQSKGFQSDESKDELQTFEQDNIERDLEIQARVRDRQNDKVFQLQSQSQKAESRQLTLSQNTIPLDQQEEKEPLHVTKQKYCQNNNKPLFQNKVTSLFSQTSNGFQESIENEHNNQSSNFSKQQSLFPTSLFQKCNFENPVSQPKKNTFQEVSFNNYQKQEQPSSFSSGWHTNSQNLQNNPFATLWKPGEVQQFQQKHINSFSSFQGSSLLQLNNITGSANTRGQIFSRNEQKSRSFPMANRELDQYTDNNLNSYEISQQSIFFRKNISFDEKCQGQSNFRPVNSFTDNIQFVRKSESYEKDQDLFGEGPSKKNDKNKKFWGRSRF